MCRRGNEVPTGAVAKVGDSEINQDEFERAETAVLGQGQGGSTRCPIRPLTSAGCEKKTPAPEGQRTPPRPLKKQ